MKERGPVLFLAWTGTSGRAQDVAAVLPGRAVLVHPTVPLLPHPLGTAIRYLLSALQTTWVLFATKPSAVIVTNPPLVPPLLVAVWSAMTRRPFVLDSHPAGFGLKDHTGLARLQGVHRLLARRARAVLVTTEALAAEVDSWGGHGLVLHEAPVVFPAPEPASGAVVLFVGIFAPDEPVQVVVEAARLLPEVTFEVTGDVARAPDNLVASAPDNVRFLGFLGTEDYRLSVARCSLLLTLTTEPTSVMRSAYEGVYARVPVVMTDTPVLRETFPHGVFCDNSSTSVADAISLALADRQRLMDVAERAAAAQEARWEGQLTGLRKACAP